MSPQSMYVSHVSPQETQLTLELQSILRVSDLSTISAKRIRHALAQEFPNDEIAQNKVFPPTPRTTNPDSPFSTNESSNASASYAKSGKAPRPPRKTHAPPPVPHKIYSNPTSTTPPHYHRNAKPLTHKVSPPLLPQRNTVQLPPSQDRNHHGRQKAMTMHGLRRNWIWR